MELDRRIVAVAAVLGVAAVAFVWFRNGPREPGEVASPATVATERDRSRRPPSHRDRADEGVVARAEQASPSPQPVEQPAGRATPSTPSPLGVDASGNFYPVPGTIDLIESRLATPNQSADRNLIVLRGEIMAALDPPAETQALEFLDNYMAYRNRGNELGLTGEFEIDVRPRFAQLRSLRREFFGLDVAQRLFGDEELANDIAIREAEIMGDADMSDEAKAAAIAELKKPPVYRNE